MSRSKLIAEGGSTSGMSFACCSGCPDSELGLVLFLSNMGSGIEVLGLRVTELRATRALYNVYEE